MNSISIIGYLTADPEKRSTPNGINVTTFTVGVTRSRKNENGDRESDFFRVTAWRATADYCANYLAKGSRVYVRGELTVRQYNGRDGHLRTQLEINAEAVENLTEKKAEVKRTSNQPNLDDFEDISSDDLPFGR